jgi:hypothetical protein
MASYREKLAAQKDRRQWSVHTGAPFADSATKCPESIASRGAFVFATARDGRRASKNGTGLGGSDPRDTGSSA